MNKAFIFFNTHRKRLKMATDKTFKVAGISKLDGEYKVRFANDLMRIKVLAKHGHEDIRLAELDEAVTKLEAARLIATMEDFADAAAQAVIAEYLEDNMPKTKAAPKAPVKAPAKPAVKAKATKTAKVVEDEEAPF
jgi:hypothetical protein